MANTITMSGALRVSGTGIEVSLSQSINATQIGSDYSAQTQAIGTSAEQLDISSDLGTPGWLMIWNLDPTNYVQIALDSGVSTQIFAKLTAGQFCIIPPQTATIYAKANTAPCNIALLAIEL